MNNERQLLLTRIKLVGDDYELNDYIQSRVEKLGHTAVSDFSSMELVNLYDAVLCRIYQ